MCGIDLFWFSLSLSSILEEAEDYFDLFEMLRKERKKTDADNWELNAEISKKLAMKFTRLTER